MPSTEPTPPLKFSFPKEYHLLRGADFDAVYKLRQSATDGWLTLHCRPNDLGHARLGLSVSRRVGNAVVRNKWKRCLREAFRLSQHRLPALDLVFTPRPGATPSLEQALRAIPSLAGRVSRRLKKQGTSSAPSPSASGPEPEKPAGPAAPSETAP